MGAADLLADCDGLLFRIPPQGANFRAAAAIPAPEGCSRYGLLFYRDNPIHRANHVEMARPGPSNLNSIDNPTPWE